LTQGAVLLIEVDDAFKKLRPSIVLSLRSLDIITRQTGEVGLEALFKDDDRKRKALRYIC